MKTYGRALSIGLFTILASHATLGQDVNLPPDPGEAGEATLAGIDSDGDGVRDDIQRHIALGYPDSARLRAALVQQARAIQEMVLWAEDGAPSESKTAMALARSIDCLAYVAGPYDGKKMSDKLQAAMLNTRERSQAYATLNVKLGGKTFERPSRDNMRASCAVDPEEFPN